jgi:hypothetical protein
VFALLVFVFVHNGISLFKSSLREASLGRIRGLTYQAAL